MTPSLGEGESASRPARATPMACLQELSESVAAIERLEHVPARVARRRACPRVAASPKMYPSRTREKSKSRHHRQHTCLFAGFLCKPSDGLEPSTPSLPSKSEAGSKARRGSHGSPASLRSRTRTSDHGWTCVPALVFPHCSLEIAVAAFGFWLANGADATSLTR